MNQPIIDGEIWDLLAKDDFHIGCVGYIMVTGIATL